MVIIRKSDTHVHAQKSAKNPLISLFFFLEIVAPIRSPLMRFGEILIYNTKLERVTYR